MRMLRLRGIGIRTSRLLLAVAAFVTILLGTAVALSTPPAGATAMKLPDPWIACYETVPTNGGFTDVIYAGIYARPYYNSTATTCRDLNVVYDEGAGYFWWYSPRPVNWHVACAYWGSRSYPWVYGGRVYCS